MKNWGLSFLPTVKFPPRLWKADSSRCHQPFTVYARHSGKNDLLTLILTLTNQSREENDIEVECVRSCDQKPYLHNEAKGGICIKIEFNPQKNISPLQHGRRFIVYSFNMAAVTSCEHSIKTKHKWSQQHQKCNCVLCRWQLSLQSFSFQALWKSLLLNKPV